MASLAARRAQRFRIVSIYGGIALFGCGVGLYYCSEREQLRYENKKWADIEAYPRHLVTTGPYSFSRNPVYLAYITMTASFGLFGSHRLFPKHYPIGLFAVVPTVVPAAIVFAFYFCVVKYEEGRLKLRFGPAYMQYTESVNRWIGFPARTNM